MQPGVAGLFISDCQWTLNPPRARCTEPDWLITQESYIQQAAELQYKTKAPLFIAGDLFELWYSSAQLISSVLHWLRGMDVYAIPGNHDLPYHSYNDLYKSAYWTLVEAGVLKHLTPGGTHGVGQLIIHPFPYGFEVKPPEKTDGVCLNVALIHAYVWAEGLGMKDADPNLRLGAWQKKLKGYDAAFFGDNHKGFVAKAKEGECKVMNCGTFMRRHTDEKDAKPCVGMLLSNGEIKRHYLDVQHDIFADLGEAPSKLEKSLDMDLSEFTEEMNNLHADRVVFAKVVARYMEKTGAPEEVRQLLLRAVKHDHNR